MAATTWKKINSIFPIHIGQRPSTLEIIQAPSLGLFEHLLCLLLVALLDKTLDNHIFSKNHAIQIPKQINQFLTLVALRKLDLHGSIIFLFQLGFEACNLLHNFPQTNMASFELNFHSQPLGIFLLELDILHLKLLLQILNLGLVFPLHFGFGDFERFIVSVLLLNFLFNFFKSFPLFFNNCRSTPSNSISFWLLSYPSIHNKTKISPSNSSLSLSL